MENPFDGLRPEMRSEHDEIRKGIFSRALRNMQVAPVEERREWCKAIRATHTAAQTAKQKRSGGGAAAAVDVVSPASSAAPLSIPAVGTKRFHAEAELDTPLPAVSSTVTATSVGQTGKKPNAQPPSSAAVLNPGGVATTKADAVEFKEEQQEQEESEASMKECIAAYLRSLLDRVVGMSLENLNVPALRVLCMMVGIKTEVRNKIALYSTLASFYYTECEKLGKRVSRDTIYTRQVEQEVAMLKSATPTASSSNKRSKDKKVAVSNTTKVAPQEGEASVDSAAARSSSSGGTNKPIGNNKAMPAAVVVSVTSKRTVDSAPAKTEKKKAAQNNTTAVAPPAKGHQTARDAKAEDVDVDHYLRYENLSEELTDEPAGAKPVSAHLYPQQHHKLCNTIQSNAHRTHAAEADVENDEGEVVYENRLFYRPDGSNSTSNATSAHMAKYAASSSASHDEWSMLMLERKVASIVQLHDPVTVTIVVKKLAQLGYHDPGATDVVEQILRRFHDRQLVFFDNGIAYLM